MRGKGEEYMPERTSFGIIRDEFVILLEFRQTATFKSGNAERATPVQRLALNDDCDGKNGSRTSGG